jgi:hypothetical protein
MHQQRSLNEAADGETVKLRLSLVERSFRAFSTALHS